MLLENSWLKYMARNHSQEWIRFWKAEVILIFLGQTIEVVFLLDSEFLLSGRCGESRKTIKMIIQPKILNMKENKTHLGKIICRIH